MKKASIVAVSFIVTFLLVLAGLRPAQYDIVAGRAAPSDIYAPREIVDELMTKARRLEAEADLQDKYDISEEATREAEKALSVAFDSIRDGREDSATSLHISGADVSPLLSLDEVAFEAFASLTLETQKTLLAAGVTDKAAALEEAHMLLSEKTRHASLAVSLLGGSLRENKFFNAEKTAEAREALRASVPPVTYKANQIIVRRGDIVSESQYAVISALGMVESEKAGVRALSAIGVFLLLASLYGALYLYMKQYSRETLANAGLLLMIAIIFFLTVLISSFGTAKAINPYLLPIIAGTMLLAILVDIRFAILYNAVVSVIAALIFEGDVFCLSSLLLSGTISAFIFTRPRGRNALVSSAGLMMAAEFLLYFAISALEGLTMRGALLRGLYGLGAGAISSVLVIGTLPFWEYAFDVTTPFKLLELANPDQPLLKRLLTEAPGTYHHSLMVGNLSEVACEAVGGNALLARTGAYYHDVGKLRRPQYYKENQYAENPHDKMDPVLSASLILSHVKEGLELARTARLPGAIRGIIASHHGTSLISFFYHKAQIETESEVSEEKFRYRGPRPQTREEAIVMLADSAEAAVRSLEQKDESSIREMVQKIIAGKLADGQMSESGLTLRDLEAIESAFVHVFCGYFHSRIKYPENEKKEN